ncbi:hypothetical protein SOASR030_09650 [Leminorella grimontii]|uniref:Transposase and inactivated derivatives n=1 Tax=Leminorella grimontii TaxID=82981 RepID=A0AAV5MYC2_9GAMM|nr:hypothetical protein SOASR030_09650 [Leminorella grimontii]GKX58270.1 hypothetical protein SOASR031_05850 [Leminorella grimontii]
MFKKRTPCRYCHDTQSVRKHGKGRAGYQRFYCVNCSRTFQVKYVYSAYYKEAEAEPAVALS